MGGQDEQRESQKKAKEEFRVHETLKSGSSLRHPFEVFLIWFLELGHLAVISDTRINFNRRGLVKPSIPVLPGTYAAFQIITLGEDGGFVNTRSLLMTENDYGKELR